MVLLEVNSGALPLSAAEATILLQQLSTLIMAKEDARDQAEQGRGEQMAEWQARIGLWSAMFVDWANNPPNAGPPGPAGPAGPAGIQGNTGPVGPQGQQGIAGPAGATGPTGAQGPRGLIGATGATGPAGERGIQGPSGVQGAPGMSAYQVAVAMGYTGTEAAYAALLGDVPLLDGINPLLEAIVAGGAIPPNGATGPQGEQGIQGIQGIQGEVGPTGPAGADGSDQVLDINTSTYFDVWVGTQAQYDALTPSATTLYFIKEA